MFTLLIIQNCTLDDFAQSFVVVYGRNFDPDDAAQSVGWVKNLKKLTDESRVIQKYTSISPAGGDDGQCRNNPASNWQAPKRRRNGGTQTYLPVLCMASRLVCL
uniref:Uncharacterized protein n=1 Tax=Romanomermis culicivorax TaxID=13658 RepID=A0A915I7P5_ROMCU